VKEMSEKELFNYFNQKLKSNKTNLYISSIIFNVIWMLVIIIYYLGNGMRGQMILIFVTLLISTTFICAKLKLFKNLRNWVKNKKILLLLSIFLDHNEFFTNIYNKKIDKVSDKLGQSSHDIYIFTQNISDMNADIIINPSLKTDLFKYKMYALKQFHIKLSQLYSLLILNILILMLVWILSYNSMMYDNYLFFYGMFILKSASIGSIQVFFNLQIFKFIIINESTLSLIIIHQYSIKGLNNNGYIFLFGIRKFINEYNNILEKIDVEYRNNNIEIKYS